MADRDVTSPRSAAEHTARARPPVQIGKPVGIRDTDIVVLGGGPAGLAAAIGVRQAGLGVELLELGHAVDARRRHDAEDVVSGIGGAGLFSDGKFSFYPSATRLWRLSDREALLTAYRWFGELLDGLAQLPPFPSEAQTRPSASSSWDGLKRYSSLYLDFESRLTLIGRLTDPLRGDVHVGTTVEELSRQPDGRLAVTYRDAGGQVGVVRARAAILAGGRFGSMGLYKQAPWLPTAFRRYEIGLRLQSSADTFFLQKHECLDPKYLLHSSTTPDVEWRTFCTCRNGEVVETRFDGLRSLSGRADVLPTPRSNVGFNVRITADPDDNSPLRQEIAAILDGKVEPFTHSLRDYLNGDAAGYGATTDALLRQGLRLLMRGGTEDIEHMTVMGPCIEGTGRYPVLDNDLRVPGTQVWAAGDQSGIFRGLTAALLSGHYAAQQASRQVDTIGRCLVPSGARA